MTKAFVIHPVINATRNDRKRVEPLIERDDQSRLEEAVGLTEALGVELVGAETTPAPTLRAATLFGSGKVADYASRFKEAKIDLVIVDAALSPLQQRNLEREWKTKVLDRTGLILEIFGDRAQTREGVLQVELAHLEYQKSRLVRSWTHLERQRGGVGFMGGPGETQIESDRRQIADKISHLKRKLEKVARTRTLHRDGRADPVVALVGYTNAGKSTLFNRLTKAEVLAKDMLFATLDPTMRVIDLPQGSSVVISDTVGFISNLPTELVAAFRATLEEVLSADIIVHVRDIADPETDAQRADVLNVLADLGVDAARRDDVLEVWNKIDLLDPDAQRAAINMSIRDGAAICISAATGEGVDDFLGEIERRLNKGASLLTLRLPPQDGAALAWLYSEGFVQHAGQDLETGDHLIEALMTRGDLGKFQKRFGALERFGLEPLRAETEIEPTTSDDAPWAASR